MTDERLRALERAEAASGASEDRARLFRERLRAGAVGLDQLSLLAYCGDAAAAAAGGDGRGAELPFVAWLGGLPGSWELLPGPWPRCFRRSAALAADSSWGLGRWGRRPATRAALALSNFMAWHSSCERCGRRGGDPRCRECAPALAAREVAARWLGGEEERLSWALVCELAADFSQEDRPAWEWAPLAVATQFWPRPGGGIRQPYWSGLPRLTAALELGAAPAECVLAVAGEEAEDELLLDACMAGLAQLYHQRAVLMQEGVAGAARAGLERHVREDVARWVLAGCP